MDELSNSDALRLIKLIHSVSGKTIGSKESVYVKADEAKVISANNTARTAVIRLTSSPDSADQNFELPNRTGYSLSANDTVWVFSWDGKTNAHIALKHGSLGLPDAGGGGSSIDTSNFMLKSAYDGNENGKVDHAEDSDTVGGFTVQKSVPPNAVFTDTVYTHPATHSPSIISQDTSNRFVSDTEKSAWNAKESAINGTTTKASIADNDGFVITDSAASDATKRTLWSVIKSALKTYFDTLYNKYIHPTFTSVTSGLYKVAVNGEGHVSGTSAVTKSDITDLGIPSQDTVYTHPANHPPSIITQDANNRFATDAEKTAWNSKQAALGFTPVPETRKVNTKALSDDISLTASDVGAAPTSHIGATGNAHGVATQLDAGFMSAADKEKLDGLDSGGGYVHPDSGVSAGTYKSVTVNAQGHVIAGTNPTTRAGYGITDAAASTVEVLATLTTTWTGSTAPYTQTVTMSGVTSSTKGVIGLPDSATATQREAARAAMLSITAKGTNTVTISADGTKPTITIPILLQILG